jgi:hypothetical protein
VLVLPDLLIGDAFSSTATLSQLNTVDIDGNFGSKPICWYLRAIYQGFPSPLPPNATTYNTNYFTAISNTIYSSEEQTVDSCPKCQSAITIEPPKNNFIASVTKSDVQIIDIQPEFYILSSSYSLPAAALSPVYGSHTGINNQDITITLQSNDNISVCVILYVNGSVYTSQTASFLTGSSFTNVTFYNVTVSSSSTLEILVTSGNCQ